MSRRLARSGWARKRFADAWVLMDRLDQAQDNAEHLYRYLKRKRPNVNAWFVLDRGSPDWSRLEREGYKLVAHGSLEWRVLLMNARHLLSSQASGYALDPLPHELYGVPKWRATFLQHGVTKDDLSRWLNPKRFDLIITASVGEKSSFTDDRTPYVFTDREVRLTGFPRHDSLLKMARKVERADVNRLLVMPTWRQTLSRDLPRDLSDEQRYQIFRGSDYAEQWLGFLGSGDLKKVAESSGLRITLLPHPNMAGYLRPNDLPDSVEVLRWADVNVQAVFARSKLLVTDYSSVAFDLAILDRSVVYFQFDRTAFFSGAQPFRRGYFDYERNGFGPVVESAGELVSALSELATREFAPEPEVKQRIESTFGQRAGDASYQVFKAVNQLDRAVRPRFVDVPLHAAVDAVPDVTMDTIADEMIADGLASEVSHHAGLLHVEEVAEDAIAEGLLRADAMSEDALPAEHLLTSETLSGDALAEGPVRADIPAVDGTSPVGSDIAAGVAASETP